MNSFLSKSRYLVLIAVISSLVAATATFLWGTYKTIIVSIHLVTAVGGEAHRIRVEAIAIMDIFLIGTALLIFSLGLHELFIGKLDLPNWMKINDLDDLKEKLRSVIIFVMTVTFLEHLVRWENAAATLMFSAAIGIMIIVLVAVGWLRRRGSG